MSDDYKGIKLPALRKIAEDKGLEDYEDMERPELLDTLNSLTDPDPTPEEDDETKEGVMDEVRFVESGEGLEVKEPEEDNLEVEEEEKSPIIKGISIERYPEGSKAASMKRKLDLQSKISIMIPLEGDKPGATFPVTLNGLRMNILKGMYVPVPKQVGEVIMESQNQTQEALAGPMRTLAHDGLPMRLDGDIGPLSR